MRPRHLAFALFVARLLLLPVQFAAQTPDHSGIISTVAGGSGGGISGPPGVAVDAAGNLYVPSGSTIAKVAPDGTITTVAGSYYRFGYGGDGGLATDATLAEPRRVAVDSSGNLYISDDFIDRIRKVDIHGIITTFAGTGTLGYSGDGGQAAAAEVYYPGGMVADPAGNVYFADIGNNIIRKVDTNGVITTYAGNVAQECSSATHNEVATELCGPYGLARDTQGNLYYSSNLEDNVHMIAPDGTITRIAGGYTGFSGDGGPALEAEFYSITDVAVDSKGYVYIADLENDRVRQVDPNGIITTVAGNGSVGFSGDGDLASDAELDYPYGLAVDTSGNLYIADSGNNRIRKVTFGPPPVADSPAFSLPAGSYTQIEPISLTDGTPDSTIYYTTDGSTPTTSSSVYSGAISVSATTTIEAMTVSPGYVTSPVVTATYNINLIAGAPSIGFQWGNNNILYAYISDITSSATVHYTLNGNPPTPNSAVYAGPIPIPTNGTTTVEAIATAPGYANSSVAQSTYVQAAAAAPAISLPSGSYNSLQYAYLSDTTPNASIYYTLDGSTPTSNSQVYNLPIYIGGKITLNAIAVAPHLLNSPVATANYNVTLPAATPPVLSPAAGKYTGSVTVTISDNTPNANIHYTLDNSTPTAQSPVYAGPFTLYASTPVKAMATAAGYWKSFDVVAQYSVVPQAPTPLITPAPGIYNQGQLIAISDADPSATIRYTTDGSTPISTSSFYSKPFAFNGPSETVQAIAIVTGQASSPVAVASYALPQAQTPVIGPPAGTYFNGQIISIGDPDGTTTIHYTIDGTPPTPSSATYSGQFAFSGASELVQAIAVLPGDRNSAIASALYVIPQTPTPTISPASGLYPAGQSISITDSDGSAVIYYTTDGTPPTISSHVYAGSLSFNGLSETIQAVALSPGKSASATAGTTYVISQVPMPTISPSAGIYGPGQLISITDVDSGAQIRFTTDGSTPSPSSNLYTGPFSFEGPSETVNAIALPTTAGQANSATASATYEFPGTIFAVNDTAAPGVAPWIYFPEGVALDSQGNLYVSDTYDTRVVKIAPNGILTTVIGNWQYATCGDGGPASGACILSPLGLAVDGAGNLYIATDNRIRRVDTQGIVTTVAGTGAAGYSKDGILATSATLDNPVGVAADSAGNFYISNQNDCRIRKVNTSGIISTVAGEGICGFSGDGRLATHAQMSHGYGIALDAAGNLYFADSGNARVRRVDAVTGIITTVAGNGTVGYGGDGGPATSGEFNLPCGVAVDAQGNLYIADNNNQRIRKVTPAGIVTTVAGNGTGGGSGDGGPAIDAELSNPLEIALDDQGTLYIADEYNGVRKVTPGTAP